MSQVAKEPIVQSQAISEAERAQKGWRIQTAMLRAYTMIIALLVVWGIFAYLTDGVFLEARNLSNLMRQTAVTGILAVGMLMIIVAGHIDLSVGSLLGLAGGVAALVQYSLGWGIICESALCLAGRSRDRRVARGAGRLSEYPGFHRNARRIARLAWGRQRRHRRADDPAQP